MSATAIAPDDQATSTGTLPEAPATPVAGTPETPDGTATLAESTGATVDLFEFVASPGALKVDRDRGIIFDTKILGWKSQNGRTYKPEGVPLSLYEGRRVYVDHAVKPGSSRSARDVFGWHENVTKRDDGLYGHFHILNPKSELAESVFQAAERRPGLFGFSHHAQGREGRDRAGITVIEAVTAVASVDLVSEPATTHSLFEEKRTDMATTVETPKPGDFWQEQVAGIMADTSLENSAKLVRIAEILRSRTRLAEVDNLDPDADPTMVALAEEQRRMRHEMERLQEERDCRDLVDGANLRFTKPEARKAFVKALIPLDAGERQALIEERRRGQRFGLTAPRASALHSHSAATRIFEEDIPDDPKATAAWLNS